MSSYKVVDYDTGQAASTLESELNGYGASGWDLNSVDMLQHSKRRAIFMQGAATGTGGIPEAPTDGQQYGRQSSSWTVVVGGTIAEAPNDGFHYGRQNLGWGKLEDVFMRWVPYTGPPQSFLHQDCTRDGDWTMVANKDTSDRPAPQQSGPEEDLLPAWAPAQQSARATYTMYNEWTVNTAGWVDQYGGTVLAQNVNALHTITLAVNGTVKDTFTSTPANPISYWHDITPILVASGAVVRVTVKVNQVGNNLMYWQEQAGLFATPPTYCSLAVGSKDGAAASSIAYDCHVQFIPGTMSPDWDVVAFGGSAAGGGAGGLEEAPSDGTTYGRLNAAWTNVLPLAGGTMTGAITLAADPTAALQATTKQYVDALPKPAATTDALPEGTTNLYYTDARVTANTTVVAKADKTYVDSQDATKAATTYVDSQDALKVAKAGDTMTGILTLSADPLAALDAATRQYVDNAIAAAKAGRAFQ